MCRDREQVLGEAVVDLAGDARALLRDSAPELRGADRAPHADEEHAVGEDPQVIAGRDRAARQQRRHDVVERGEEQQCRPQGDPAVEVPAPSPEATAEADHCDEIEQRLQREREREQERRGVATRRGERRQRRPERRGHGPEDDEHEDERRHGLRDDPSTTARPAACECGDGDQTRAQQPPADPRPSLRLMQGLTAEDRRDREGERRARADRESTREQEVQPATVDRVLRCGEHGHDRAREHDRRLEREPERGEVVGRLEAGVRHEERERRAEQPEEENLAPEERFEGISVVLPHRHPCRQNSSRR